MLKCNLAILLAERKLRISKVSEDTGISRTTLTSLSNNYSQGIQLDTLNKLCLYLQVSPDRLFAYIPFDYRVSVSREGGDAFRISMTFTSKGGAKTADLFAQVSADYDIEPSDEDDPHSVPVKMLTNVRIVLDLYPPDGDLSVEEENQLLIRYLSTMPAIFKTDVEDTVTATICADLEGDVEAPELSCAFEWPTELA